MDSEESSTKDKNFSSQYEEDSRDSDIESRLYAEIHYTNAIIGDESNVSENPSNDDYGNKKSIEPKSAIPVLQSQSDVQTNQSVNHTHKQQRLPDASAQNNTKASTISNSAHENMASLQSNVHSHFQKRPSIIESCQDEPNKKKKKQQNRNDDAKSTNTIINPYHKDANNQQYGIKLLSPAFLSLFFGKSKSKKKKTANKKLIPVAQPSKVSISCNTPAINAPQENVIQNSLENQVIQNETEVSSALDSETIIDICSESSKDSTEDNSKYNNIEATDKKLTKQNASIDVVNSDDDSSDSNESIFEVPVPPKPAPPVIELNDSDNENIDISDDTDSSSDSDFDQENVQNDKRSVTNSTKNFQDQEDSISESSESNNLILNCTEIQKGVSSISDIKRLSHEPSSKTSFANEINRSDNPQSDSEILVNTVSREQIAGPTKEKNSSITKKASKSPQTQVRQDVREKSFFKPMSDKMKSFYNDSWGGENFDLEELKSQMTRDPKKWAILEEDLIGSFSKRKRYFGMVCSRCQKDGHRPNQCPVPYKIPTCHMCGIQGHYETSCPEKKCLTCGKKQNMYRKTCEHCVKMVCSRCKARGHKEYFCPDLWRSYHQTVNNTKPNVPNNIRTVMKPQHSVYCCNCAKKGHDSQNCRKLRWSEHFPVPSHVTSYDGPEYSKENVRTGNNINNPESFCENSFTLGNSLDKIAHRNLTHDELPSFARSQISNTDRNIIFKIKSKGNIDNEVLVKVQFNLNIPNKNEPNNYNYWNSLSTFLYELVNEISGEFLLSQNNHQVIMEMRVPRKTRTKLEKLIQQYARRNNFERSYMYLSCVRNLNCITEHLTDKFNQINNMTSSKDILEMYEELKSLKSSENELQTNAFKKQKLIACLKELLAALYMEGCPNNSLLILKKLYNKMKKQEKLSGKMTRKKLKQKEAPETKITLKVLLEYLIHYNSIFVPYEPSNLNVLIGMHKKRLEQRKRLMNNPLLFPQGCNKTDKLATESSSFSNTVTTENMLASSSSTSSQIPSLLFTNTSTISQIQPTESQVSQVQPMNSLLQPAISANNSRPLLSINTSISGNFHFSQNLPTVASNVEINRKKDKRTNKYKKLLKRTKKLIATARDLNIPQARKHVEILEKKIKNGIYLFQKDIFMLQMLVNKNR